MKFKEILNRVTGLSSPVFGMSWNPQELEVTKARRIITFLEDRRVLFYPDIHETPDYAIRSVLEIRAFLTVEISNLSSDSELAKSLRAMRAACRRFLDASEREDPEAYRFVRPIYFFSRLGEFRGVFGIHLALIAAQYGLDIEDELAVILPAKEESDESPKAVANHQGDLAKKKRVKGMDKKKVVKKKLK